MKVSVIVPVFNAEAFLEQSVRSVLGQSHEDLELILVDDGSTDGSAALCREFRSVDPRVRVFRQPNGGPAAARNRGLREANGDFVFFLDADDFIVRNCLELLLEAYADRPADLVMGNFGKLVNATDIVAQRMSFRPDNRPTTTGRTVLNRSEIMAYVRHFLNHPSNHLVSYCWGRLYRLSIIRKNAIAANESMRLFEDFVFNLEYLKHTREIVFVNAPLYTYRMHAEHVSASMAMIRSASLIHDMTVFRTKTTEFLDHADSATPSPNVIDREIGHALIHYAIIFLVRSCRRVNSRNRLEIRRRIRRIVRAPILRESLGHYRPTRGNSRMLPILMRFELVRPLMIIAQYKAYKRYGRPQSS